MKTQANAPQVLKYYINLDERGEFYADIRDESENTILEILYQKDN